MSSEISAKILHEWDAELAPVVTRLAIPAWACKCLYLRGAIEAISAVSGLSTEGVLPLIGRMPEEGSLPDLPGPGRT